MSNRTEGGAARAVMRLELGEWMSKNRAAERVLTTPARPDALILCLSTGRDLDVMMSRTPGAPPQDASPNSVYLYYDEYGTLLYVGVTERGIVRNREHNSAAEWWPFVARQEVEHHPNRALALRREKALIREHRPPFNRIYNPEHAELKSEYLKWHAEGPNDADAGQMARAINRTLPLEIIDIGHDDKFALRSFPEHSPIARRLLDVKGAMVRSGVPLGTVIEQRVQGPYGLLLVRWGHRARLERPDLAKVAIAPLKFVNQKGRSGFRVTCIEIARPHQVTAS